MPPSSNQTRTSDGSSCSAALKAASAAERSPRRAETCAWRWNRSGRPGASVCASRMQSSAPSASFTASRTRARATSTSTSPRTRRASSSASGAASPAAAEGDERADLAQRGVGIVRRGGARRAVPLERLAVETALGENVAQQDRVAPRGRAARRGPAQLGRGEIEQPLRDVVARQVERVARRAVAAPPGRRGCELGEELVERRRIERELAGQQPRRRPRRRARERWRSWDPRTADRSSARTSAARTAARARAPAGSRAARRRSRRAG